MVVWEPPVAAGVRALLDCRFNSPAKETLLDLLDCRDALCATCGLALCGAAGFVASTRLPASLLLLAVLGLLPLLLLLTPALVPPALDLLLPASGG